jgi:uncharacterized protein Usg
MAKNLDFPHVCLPNYRLLTAEITYHMPDHPQLLQVYLWQEFDLLPDYPELAKFLNFWQANLDGKLHSVIVSSTDAFEKQEFTFADGHFALH